MIKKITLLIFTIILTIQVSAQNKQLSFSDSSVVSLITCSPGKQAYSAFGHTAIRINDPLSKTDVVFNYGIFSFQTKNFYYKFIKGETDYQLGVYDTKIFLPEYQERNSQVWEQVLNLKKAEKRKLINLLVENYKPENRTYRYNFIYDNCSTRPRNIIWDALDGYIETHHIAEKKTFRQWVEVYTGSDTWLKFGIDLVFGLDADKIATDNESKFLPEVLMNSAQNARIKSDDGTNRKLISKNAILVNKIDEGALDQSLINKPLGLSLILLLVGGLITAWDIKRKKHSKLFDALLFLASGIGGLIVFYLMCFSIHPLVQYNLNILWLNPLNLFVIGILWVRSCRKIRMYYQVINASLLAIALISFSLSIQDFNIAVFPLIVLLFMRSVGWLAYVKRKTGKKRDIYLRKLN